MSASNLSVARSLARASWTLRRFGLTPGGVLSRLRERGAPRVLCVCIPKAGTHLLERALCLHPALYRKLVGTVNDTNLSERNGLPSLLDGLRSGQVLMSHLRFSAERRDTIESKGVRCLFLVRDPRDIVVSLAMYISRNRRHAFHDIFRDKPDLKDRLRLTIEGDPARQFPSMGERLRMFAGWLHSDCCVVRFEDLVGWWGGGSVSKQLETLHSTFGHLGVDQSEELVASVGERLFSAVSPTFRKGRIGEWRRYFDTETTDRFMEVAGDCMASYGYSLVDNRTEPALLTTT